MSIRRMCPHCGKDTRMGLVERARKAAGVRWGKEVGRAVAVALPLTGSVKRRLEAQGVKRTCSKCPPVCGPLCRCICHVPNEVA